MEPQTLLATLHEHFPSQVTGQHDILAADTASAGTRRDDITGVVITVLALIGIMLAVAALDGSAAPLPPSSPSHFSTSIR